MKSTAQQIYTDFNMRRLGYDFMGYEFDDKKQLSFHHLIVPHRDCKQMGLGKGYQYWNGVILRQDTAHDYLHLVEAKDYDRFLAITSEMIDEKALLKIELENLKRISDILNGFEREHCGDTTKKGKSLIKESYTRRLIR